MSVIGKLGFDSIIIRESAAYLERRDFSRLLGLGRFSFKSMLTASLLAVAIAIATIRWNKLDNGQLPVLLWAFLLVPLNALLVWVSAFQLGHSRVARAQIPAQVLFPSLFALMLLALSRWGAQKPEAVLVVQIQIVATILALGYALAVLRSSFTPAISAAPALYESLRWFTGAVKLMLVESMNLVNVNADILLLGALVGPEAAGIYKVATRGADLVLYALTVVSVPLAPMIARLHESGDQAQLRRVITLSTRGASLIALPIAVGLIFFGGNFLALFGHEFIRGRLALAILSVAQLMNAVTGPVSRIMIMARRESKTAIAMTTGAVSNIALNLVLIPRYGIVGAAIATTISMMLWNGMLVFEVWSKLGIDPTVLGLGRRGHNEI